MTDMTSGLMGHSQLTTIDQSELSSQLGLSLGGGTILPPAQSPEDRLSTTPSPTSSLHEDGVEDFRRQLPSQKTVVVEAGKKQKAPKKRKKKDPNEPQKPVSAYALFFRDTQAAIKGQNPNATFGEVSKIVASMWDSLGEEQKQHYHMPTFLLMGKIFRHSAWQSRDRRITSNLIHFGTLLLSQVESPSQMDVELVSGSPVALSPQPRCVRSGCENPPIVSKDWDNEYCSNECVVKHCRDVFLAWVASRNSNTVVFVK
uniref:TOX high mobility group box family member 4 n=1 Tax=Rhinopithecus bieti TaxID=61621 RepID=A0A2K6LVB0_RHIBE